MCYPAKEYLVGEDDVLIGKIGDIPFYISETQHEAWKNTDLIIDCIEGMGGMFSLRQWYWQKIFNKIRNLYS